MTKSKHIQNRLFNTRARPFSDAFWERVDVREPQECWLWMTGQFAKSGYGCCKERGTGRALLAHRVAFEQINGKIPHLMHVLHSCDVRLCCNPLHMRLGNNRENVNDRVSRARTKTCPQDGENNGCAKLRDRDIPHIRAINGWTQKDIAELYGVKRSTISAIIRRRNWEHVP